MKNQQQIQSEIEASARLPKFDTFPEVIECWNEREILWRTDRGRSYPHIIDARPYQYHLMYFDGRLAIVEQAQVTIFSHLTARLAEEMSRESPPNQVTTPTAIAPITYNQDGISVISVDDLVELCRRKPE